MTPSSTARIVSEVGTAVPIASCSWSAAQAVGDDPLGDQGAGGVVDEDAGLGRVVPGADVGEGVADRVRAGGAALDDRADLAADQSLRLIVVGGGHDEQDLVDAGSGGRGERRDAVLDERPAVEGEQLLGQCRTEPGARAAAEYHRHHAFHRHISGLYPVFEAGSSKESGVAGYAEVTALSQWIAVPGRRAARRRHEPPECAPVRALPAPPLTLSRISVGFAVIAAVWLTVASVHGEVIALVAAVAVVVVRPRRPGARRPAVRGRRRVGPGRLRHARRVPGLRGDRRGGQPAPAAAQPGLAGNSLRGTFVAGLGGAGTAGVWRLAIIAVILTVLTPMVDLCVHGPALPGTRLRLFGPPGDVRLPAGLRRRPAVRRPGGLPRRARARRGRARRDGHRRHPPGAGPGRAARLPRRRPDRDLDRQVGRRPGAAACRRCSSGCSSPGC